MKQKIFESLKTKYSNLGFSKEVLEGVAANFSAFVTAEDQIATAVEGAEPMLKSFQSFADGRVNAFKKDSDTHKTEAEQLKARLAELEKSAEPPKAGDDYSKFLETMQEIQKDLAGFKNQRTSQSLTQKFSSIMIEKKIPESYYKNAIVGRELLDEEKVLELAENVSQNFEAHTQELANQGFVQTTPPEQGKGSVEKESKAIADMINQGTQAIVAKKEN